MDVVGGLRARLIRESLFRTVEQSLTDLDWFNSGNPTLPITFDSRSRNQDEQIMINTLTLSDENTSGTPVELGSQLSEERWSMYIDFYADSDALGLHLIRDVKDILEGRISLIGRTDPSFDVFDYRQATPPILFRCQIENVTVDRAHGFLKPWLEHWYACSFTVVDYYSRDDG